MKKEIILFIILFLPISYISGLCNQGQIDINEASLEELDELYGVGAVRAQAIIDTRPFDSVNNLINVYGIGEITLDKIIEQGLACVSDEQESEKIPEKEHEEIEDETEDEVIEEEKENKVSINLLQGDIIINKNINNPNNYTIEKEKISLIDSNGETKDIKTGENKEELSKNNYAIYWLITFFVLILFLSILRKYNNTRKNEFK